MRLSTLLSFAMALLLLAPVASAQSARGSRTTAAPAATAPDAGAFARAIIDAEPQSLVPGFSESFDNVATLPGSGWSLQNRSTTVGTNPSWVQGDGPTFPAQSGALNAYISANYNNTTGASTISNWLITPEVDLANGTTLTFYSRVLANPATYPDRLEVRLSTAGASTNVGTTPTSVGDFTTVMLTINPTLTTTGYPNVWTQFTATVSGLGAATTGRFAFRYFVTNGGPAGANSDYIGVDEVVVTPGPPATAFAFVAPTAGRTYRAGGWLKPIWTTTPSGGSGDVTATLRKGGVDVATLYAGPNLFQPNFGDARYLLPVDIAGGTDYTVYVELDSNPAVNAESDAFTIVSGAVTVTAPAGGATFAAGDATTVTFTLDNIDSPARARVYLRRTGQAGSTRLATENDTDGSVDVTLPADAATAGDYYLLVRVSNDASNVTGKSGTFTINGAPPVTTPQPTHFVVEAAVSTRESFLLVPTAGLTGEIGVFAGDVLVGSARVAGATTEVVVFGSDLADDEALTLRSFAAGVERVLETTSAVTFGDGDETAVTLKGGTSEASSASLTVSASPNPASSGATIRVSSPSSVVVYDVLGRVVADLGAVATDVRWDASAASPGVYVIRATAATGATSVRVTIAR